MKKGRRVLAVVVALCMVLGVVVCPTDMERVRAEASGDYEYSVLDDGSVEITKYTGSDTKMEIPGEIDGKQVTSIGKEAFWACSWLAEITIPAGVTSIGDFVFFGCSGLTEITISAGVTSIGAWTFSGCSSLKDVYYSGTEGQWNKIEIASSGNDVLLKANKHFNSEDNPKSDYEYEILNDTIEITKYKGSDAEVEIPLQLEGMSVSSIGAKAFYGRSGITKIICPDSITKIGEYAFQNCQKLTDVVLSRDLVRIGTGAFYDCAELGKINIPEGITYIGGYAFRGCKKLTDINIPEGVTSIGGGTFYECTGLSGISLPSGITHIDSSAFYHCYNLTSINLPSSLTRIEDTAFSGCRSLTTISLPTGVISIGNAVFSNCTGLTEISFPSGLANIGEQAFQDCTGLVKIELPNGVKSIKEATFAGCTGLAEIHIPESMEDIRQEAFQNCSSLSDVYYADTREQWDKIVISDKDNEALRSAKIHCKDSADDPVDDPTDDPVKDFKYEIQRDGAIEITAYTGSDTKVKIPDLIEGKQVTSIGTHTFSENDIPEEITIPSSITMLATREEVGNRGINCFAYCRNLKEIYADDGNENFSSEKGVLLNKQKTEIIVYPQGRQGEYVIPSGVTAIRNYAFDSCKNLTEISIPSSVQSIGYHAFYDCIRLKDVYYSGLKSQWDEIAIDMDGNGNAALVNAVIHFRDGTTLNGPQTEEPQKPEILDTRQELDRLKEGDSLRLEQDFQHYLSKEQMDMMESYLYTWLAELNHTYQYSGSRSVKKRIMKKAGIDPQGDVASGREQAVTHICVETKYGAKTIEVTLDLGAPDENGNLYPAYGAMRYEILEKESIPSDLPKSGQIGRESYADLGTFAECVRKASEDSLRGTYQWESLDEEMTAGVLVDKTVTEIIGNKNGSFSDAVFTIYAKPLVTYSKKVTIACPVDVHVYSMDGKEAGSIVGNRPDGGNADVRLVVNGDTKTVYLAGNDYYLSLHGTDTGTMRYEVEEIANGEVRRNVQFLELQLKKDMQYEGYVFRPLNIDRDLYALRSVGSTDQKVYYVDHDTMQALFRRIQSLSLSQGQTILDRNRTVQLQAGMFPLDASNPNLQWTTDNGSVAKVDQNGLVTAVGAGRATVTVATKDGSFLKQYCVIDVADQAYVSDSSSGWYGGGTSAPVEQEKQPVVVNLHYVLQFQTNGGTNLSRKTMTLLKDDVPGIMPKVQRKDYLFDGWYTQQDGGERVNGDKPLTEAATLYARWTKAEAPAKPAAPVLKSKKKGQMQVSFQNVNGAAGYQIAYAADKKFTSAKTKEAGASAKTKTISGLKAGKKYYVRVRAYRFDSMKNKIYGAYSSVKGIKVKSE